MNSRFTRRTVLATAAALAAPALAAGSARIVVIGGGFAGATFAREAKRLMSSATITLVEPQAATGRAYHACPYSNHVIAGMRDLTEQQFGYDGLRAEGIDIWAESAAEIDAVGRRIRLKSGSHLAWDRLIVSPGIALREDAIPGYDATAMPHAWQAGEQTLLLRDRLRGMADGGTVVIAVPAAPFRCPPGPYERASLIAGFLQREKPRSRVVILDSNDAFSKQPLFEAAWAEHYPGLIEWVPGTFGGRLVSVDAIAGIVETEFDRISAAVANIIPPQQAGIIAQQGGLADASGWCPVDGTTFRSTIVPGVYVLGDAAIANAMPKSAFSAAVQAKICAHQIARDLIGLSASTTVLANTCYSTVAPDHGITVADVYRPDGHRLVPVEGAGGISPANASIEMRADEARQGEAWFRQATLEAFG